MEGKIEEKRSKASLYIPEQYRDFVFQDKEVINDEKLSQCDLLKVLGLI